MYAHFCFRKVAEALNLQDIKRVTYSFVKKVSQVCGSGEGMCGIVVGDAF